MFARSFTKRLHAGARVSCVSRVATFLIQRGAVAVPRCTAKDYLNH